VSHIFRHAGDALLMARLARRETLLQTAERSRIELAELVRYEESAGLPPHPDLLLLLDMHRTSFENFVHLMATLSHLDGLARFGGNEVVDVFARFVLMKREDRLRPVPSRTSRHFGAVLTMFRILRCLSQQELARLSGIEPGEIERFESGERLPGEDEAVYLLEVLGVNSRALTDALNLAVSLDCA
jgi:transcriptional regulator with XRE-family HTH domain